MPLVPREDERVVTLVLCDADGSTLGQLEPLVVPGRFWPEVGGLVELVRRRHGLDVVVLRLLTTSGGYAGGRVAYLAQLLSGPPTRLTPVHPGTAAALAADPRHRQWWAEPDGVTSLAGWVDEALDAHHRRRTSPLRQRKTWNLSLLVSAATTAGEVWLKATPPFLADEGGIMGRIAALDPDLVPQVLAHDPARRLLLMDHVPGEDQWGLVDEAVIEAMVERWVAVQQASATDVDHLLSLGAADLRSAALVRAVESAACRPETRTDLDAVELAALDALVGGLPARLAAVGECGMPDTVVHGDLHPGNWRRDGDLVTLLDWGDVGVGHPLLDLRAFVERVDGPDLRARVRARWLTRWGTAVPGSDPYRAAALLAPVAELAAAATYRRFLDHIEVTERVYHAHDPADRLRAAIAAT